MRFGETIIIETIMNGTSFHEIVSIVDLFGLNSFKDPFSITINQYMAVLIKLYIIEPKSISLESQGKVTINNYSMKFLVCSLNHFWTELSLIL